jgi:hypothetical protein
MMNREETFSIWAPEQSLWSRWAKPVLFAYLDAIHPQVVVWDIPDVNWVPSAAEKTAMVLDLHGAQGVLMGIALAGKGYRPVPLYNAVPLPFGEPFIDFLTGKPVAAVDVTPIVCALTKGAEQLAQFKLPHDAPPAFLLDSNRAGDGRKIGPDEFDNRSISFTTDFPSANFLAVQGIQSAILAQANRLEPQSDLAHTLRRWQDAGFVLKRKRINAPGPAEPFEVTKPSWYGTMFQRALCSIGLQRSDSGGFGAWVPESSSGG